MTTLRSALVLLVLWIISLIVYSSIYWTDKRRPAPCISPSPVNSKRHGRRPHKLLTVKPSGRLGNQLFEWAALVGIANLSNREIAIPHGLLPLYRTFSMKKCNYTILTNDSDVDFLDIIVHNSMGYNNEIAEELSKIEDNIRIQGYMQSFKYFQHVEETFRRCLHFRKELIENIDIFIQTHNQMQNVSSYQNITYVGVHCRRGDFTKTRAHVRGLSVAPKTFYQKAMHYMTKNYPNVIFIITSDDKRWLKKRFNQSHNVIFSPFWNPVHDLALLSACNHSIISSGTYSWWSGWLAGGSVVYYNNYPRRGSSISINFDYGDYYKEKWVGIGD